jgi:hypothetical protein
MSEPRSRLLGRAAAAERPRRAVRRVRRVSFVFFAFAEGAVDVMLCEVCDLGEQLFCLVGYDRAGSCRK